MRSLDDLRAVFDDFERAVDERLDNRNAPSTTDAVSETRTTYRVRAGATRRRVLAPLLAAAAVAVLTIGTTVYLPSDKDGGSGLPPAGAPYPAPGATHDVLDGQYGHTSITVVTSGSGDGTTRIERSEEWVAPNGSTWRYTRTTTGGTCEAFPFSGEPSFSGPTAAFVDALPTSVDALQAYLERHVQGSSSREEAIFVAIGDLLRDGDALASVGLRGSLLRVLARTPGVHIDTRVQDQAGRDAIQAAFVDPQRRPGSIDSLYFEPGSYHLLQEMTSATAGDVPPANAPSVPYSQAPSSVSKIPVSNGRATIVLYRDRTIVDELPTRATMGC